MSISSCLECFTIIQSEKLLIAAALCICVFCACLSIWFCCRKKNDTGSDICVSGCGNCRELNAQVTNLKRWKIQSDETINALRNDATRKTLSIGILEAKIADQDVTIKNLQKGFNSLCGNESLITLREVCYSLEENVCYELFGPTAVEDLSYRFSNLKENVDQLKRRDEILASMGLNISIFRTLKKAGDTLVHRDRTPISAEELQNLITPRIGSKNSSAFMAALNKYHFIDVAGKVDTFMSPFPNRQAR